MKILFRIVTVLIIIVGFTSMNLKDKDFHVIIEQNGEFIEPNNGVVTLDKSTFNIVFEFNEPMGLLINGSFKKNTYMLATKGKHKSKLPGFHHTGMAEGLLNPDKEIFISNDSPNYWFFDDNEKNRFNYIEKVDGKIICTRVIENFYDVHTKTNIKVENVNEPLYLVFISYMRGENITDVIEIKRECIKIKWNE